MNPDQIARQAVAARMQGSPMPVVSQVPGGVQAPTPQQSQMPTPQHQLGDKTPDHQKGPEDALAKSALAGASHPDDHVRVLSKLLLQKLMPYLGQGGQQKP